MSFKNKVVIVTGASSGIGAATAVAFSDAGAHVSMVGRNDIRLKAVATKCTNPLVILADVTNNDDAKRIIDETVKKFGRLDVLVNNAGTAAMNSGLLNENVMETYDTLMNLNVRSVINLTHLAVPHLIKSKGNVVNISSVSGIVSPIVPGAIIYCVSKAALNHFSVSAAAELGPHGVRVNGICPGIVKTEFLENAKFPFTWNDLAKISILDKVCEVDEVTDLVMYLASDKAKSITGSNYVIDNGLSVKQM